MNKTQLQDLLKVMLNETELLKQEIAAAHPQKKDIFDYEEVVSKIEEAMALAYFVYESQKDEYLDGKAVRGIYRLLERLSDEVRELFERACEIQRELDQIKGAHND